MVNATRGDRGSAWNLKRPDVQQDKCEIHRVSREYRRKASESAGPAIVTSEADDVAVWTGKCDAQCEVGYVVHRAVGQGKVQRVLRESRPWMDRTHRCDYDFIGSVSIKGFEKLSDGEHGSGQESERAMITAPGYWSA